ncbi:hypothetical protein GIW81_00840 [Hyphomicrobium sp. xq]|uniref:Uncharacterized protein n=1 Tax=Hyphomicrobium album TaxID=2665159 RepID=A0A6I3KDE5_9HYPH|nr:hypothetical protein [Hyphomicrobium album]MTD92874.1 hypothetical protein [Hyphomicrobium album]
MRADTAFLAGGSRQKRNGRKKFVRRMEHRPEKDRQVFALLRAIKKLSAGDVMRAADKAGFFISDQTVRNLRRGKGGTKYPQRYSMDAMASAVGLTFALVPPDCGDIFKP